MCLYPRFIINRKYTATKKNGGVIPNIIDKRTMFVPIGCGQCIECRRQKARMWKIRLIEEMKSNKEIPTFITYSFSPEAIKKLEIKYKINTVNELATKATKLWRERYRKIFGKSVKHWFITELGHTNTERIHIHGIIWSDNINKVDIKEFYTDENIKEIREEIHKEIWKYGNVYVGKYCNMQTANYIIKYLTKIDKDHFDYLPIILTSPGIGKAYINTQSKKRHRYVSRETIQYYTNDQGYKMNLPIYYRNKLYTEEEREKLWIELLDKDERYILGQKIENFSTEKGQKEYETKLKNAQEYNKRLGYGDDSKKFKLKDYNITCRMIKKYGELYKNNNKK